MTKGRPSNQARRAKRRENGIDLKVKGRKGKILYKITLEKEK
jgi:hypothetical protein